MVATFLVSRIQQFLSQALFLAAFLSHASLLSLSKEHLLTRINTSLIIDMTFSDDGETMYPHVYQSWDEVEKTHKGVPLNPAINAQYMPSVNIASSGTSVEFTLNFISGQSYMRNSISGAMMAPKDMTGWIYAIDIDLDFAGISRGDLDKGIAVPENVLKQLESFTTDQFSVTSLFMNFQSTNLMRFNPVSTSVGTAGSSALSYFTTFMGEYLGAVSKDQAHNPYILGYSSKFGTASQPYP